MLKNSQSKLYSKGFTILELLVIFSIILILATVVTYEGRRLSDNTAVRVAADELNRRLNKNNVSASVALEFKPGSQIYPSAYGIHLDTSTPDRYYIFAESADLPSVEDKAYDGAIELLSTVYLEDGVTINKLCTETPPAAENCSTMLNITHAENNSSIIINGDTTGATLSRIEFISKRGVVREVKTLATSKLIEVN